LFLMLGYPHDVENMLLHPDTGILKHMKKGAYVIDHTTSTPSIAVKVFEAAALQGVKSIDAPVSGGDIGARNGCLVTMCGG
jgi:3-hydroxyisobutyrate dehydrogenase